MSETTNTQPDDQHEPDQPVNKKDANQEAAKYRRKLRELETAHDELKTRLEETQKSMAERLSGLRKPTALWAAGITLDDMLNEEGQLDEELVKEAVRTATETLGLQHGPKPDPSQGNSTPQRRVTFADAFNIN